MAGAGFKDFVAGDVLTADQVDTYLMQQTVMRFASSTARDTALSGVLAEGLFAYLDDTNLVTYYTGSGWTNVTPFAGYGSRFELRHSAAVSLTDQTATAIPWDTEVTDTDSFHAANGEYVTIPTAGLYHFTFTAVLEQSANDIYFECYLGKGTSNPAANSSDRWQGSSVMRTNDTLLTSSAMTVHCSAVINCAASDVIKPWLYQNNESGDSTLSTLANRKDLMLFSGARIG